jgi:hypothetical protein
MGMHRYPEIGDNMLTLSAGSNGGQHAVPISGPLAASIGKINGFRYSAICAHRRRIKWRHNERAERRLAVASEAAYGARCSSRRLAATSRYSFVLH